jgi:hypothetical protein
MTSKGTHWRTIYRVTCGCGSEILYSPEVVNERLEMLPLDCPPFDPVKPDIHKCEKAKTLMED